MGSESYDFLISEQNHEQLEGDGKTETSGRAVIAKQTLGQLSYSGNSLFETKACDFRTAVTRRACAKSGMGALNEAQDVSDPC